MYYNYCLSRECLGLLHNPRVLNPVCFLHTSVKNKVDLVSLAFRGSNSAIFIFAFLPNGSTFNGSDSPGAYFVA